jgi:biopolymer transport protein ExbD
LILSVIAAPIVIIIMIVLSVLPLSSRSKPKWFPLMAAIVIEILLVAAAVAIPFLINEPKRKNELVNLPTDFFAEVDYDIAKETSVILTLTSDNKLSERQNRDISREELPAKLKSLMEGKTPDKRIVYLKCDVNATYENVLQIFDIIRNADIDKVGLVVIGEKNENDPYQIKPKKFEVKLPEPPTDKINVMVKPNPLTLVATLDKDGKLKLNNEGMGIISDSEKFVNRLKQVFKDREYAGVFREGTNEVEKTIFLKVSESSKYGDFIKLVDAVKIAGAQPIGIQIDDVGL